MCGFTGYLDMRRRRDADASIVKRMTDQLVHRGPDSDGYFLCGTTGLGFRRLSIIDLAGGDQPIENEDSSLVLLCNGEIYNFRELRAELEQKGHRFRTRSDVEVLLHLYEDEGPRMLDRINGQFAFVIYDRRREELFLARDHFGVNPLYYTSVDDVFIFASEIKAILEHPAVERAVDLTGLDQVLSFPGLVSPRSMFKGIRSLAGGRSILVRNGSFEEREYWDLDYPRDGEISYERPEQEYIDELGDCLRNSVRYRLQADVPVGFYLSGGLDSSLIGALIHQLSPNASRRSFSIGFATKEICESKYQKLLARHVSSIHREIVFSWEQIAERLERMIYHTECPVKETYNTCSMALSEAAKNSGVSVILTGEGADELFAGYVGYRFDQFGLRASGGADLDALLEEELQEKLWGDKRLFYETDHHAFREIKSALYSHGLNELYEHFDCLNESPVNLDRLRGRHPIHQRSYLDFKLRLSDHLISDHGDRMALANAVEARYPFLDLGVVDFARLTPPELKLNNFTEKYILRKAAEGLVPQPILDREKYGFHAPGSPYLLQQKIAWIEDHLSYDRIKRQGYFNPDAVERLKKQYSQEGFKLNLPFESDLLMIVLSFGIWKDLFKLPNIP